VHVEDQPGKRVDIRLYVGESDKPLTLDNIRADVPVSIPVSTSDSLGLGYSEFQLHNIQLSGREWLCLQAQLSATQGDSPPPPRSATVLVHGKVRLALIRSTLRR
jgi:hypothetical protein